VAGYRDVLATVHASAEYMNLLPGLILQMDRDLRQYAGTTGGRFKIMILQLLRVTPTVRNVFVSLQYQHGKHPLLLMNL
jgi:hypothetical protein